MADHPTTAAPHDVHVIAPGDDHRVVEMLARWRTAHPDEPVVAVFAEPALASVYAGEAPITALAWLPDFGRRVATAMPPSPRATVAPPAVVVGDGRIARYLVTALIEGWADPGQPLGVHCLGEDAGWAQEAEVAAQPRGRLTWSQTPTRPIPVVRRIMELVDAWEPPARKRGDPTGPTVLVALDDPISTMSIAAAVAASVPDARVGAVVPDAAPWPPVAGVSVFATADGRVAVVDARHTPLATLAEQLLADLAWVSAPDALATRADAPIVTDASYDTTGDPLALHDQPALLRAQLTAIAAALPEIAAAGSLERVDPTLRIEPVILTPSELRGMASEVLAALGVADDPRTRQAAVELAHLLPGIASRAGQPLGRPSGHVPLLTFDDIERLAPLVHLAYTDISAETGNATASPLAGALWDQLTEFERAGNRAVLVGVAVGHALLGLDWRSSSQPTAYAFDVEEFERLAELEHRRWAIHQRRNGAPAHRWMEPWAVPGGPGLADDVKEYDRHIMRQVIGILAAAGVEVTKS